MLGSTLYNISDFLQGCCMKILILGDSISKGLGSKAINYEVRLKENLESFFEPVEIINKSIISSTILDGIQCIKEIADKQIDVAIVMYGSVEAENRPNIMNNYYNLVSICPRRIKGSINKPGNIFPRPFYSQNLFKRVVQSLENLTRKFWRFVLGKTQGVAVAMDINAFSYNYESALNFLKKRGIKTICCSCMFCDDTIYFKSNDNYEKYNNVIKNLATQKGFAYYDMFERFKVLVKDKGWSFFYKDRFHPNQSGYEIIGDDLANIATSLLAG